MDLAPPIFIALTPNGAEIASRLAKALGGGWHASTNALAGWDGLAPDASIDSVSTHIPMLFLAGKPIVAVCAAGIVIRSLAGHAQSKHHEPAVLAMSEDGKHIIPLLGGHHGGNSLAQKIAEVTGGVAAITTASDVTLGLALDCPPEGIVLAQNAPIKSAMAYLLAGGRAWLSCDLPQSLANTEARWREWLAPIATADKTTAALTLHLSLRPAPDDEAICTFHPKCVSLGVGASRGCPPEEMEELFQQGLGIADTALGAIEGIYSIDLKADEAAVLALAESLGLDLRLFTADRLEAETPRLIEPSAQVFKAIGCHGVAESAVLAAAGAAAEVILPKIRSAQATMAMAFRPDNAPEGDKGRRHGRVMLVGIGPGQHQWRTVEATQMIAKADMLVGYGFYIDLLGGLAAGKPRRDFALGEEEARCRYALEEAANGKDIALICSGDAGIYAMAALVYELLASDVGEARLSDSARRVSIITAPGVSAMQAAAARTGAILGHDFCAISLSDLLTPWPRIENRITAAAKADFVIAFYNPVSSRRKEGMAQAKAILLSYRPWDTPVVVATNLGRHGENLHHCHLNALDIDALDMMTVVLVGATTTRRLTHHGKTVVFTPRGYGGGYAEKKGDEDKTL